MEIHGIAAIAVGVMLAASMFALLGFVSIPAASAMFPGTNGRIVFESQRDGNPEIYVMNADGSGQTRLTNNTNVDTFPYWSPDNSKIAFVTDRDGNNEIYIMDADGTDQINVSNNSAADDSSVSWSPDGSKLAFTRDGDVYVMNSDGSGKTRLTRDASAQHVSWSPDGEKMAYARDYRQIFVMNADGTGQIDISNTTGTYISDFLPNWSPDSSKITFTTAGRDAPCCVIYTMHADGSGKTRLMPGVGLDFSSSWSPDGTKIAFGGSWTGPDATAPTFEIYTVNAYGSSDIPTRLTFNDAADRFPDWGSAPGMQPLPHSTLTVKSGIWYQHQEFSGIWATVYSMNGTLLKSGYTPLTFVGDTGTQYKVNVANYDGKIFDFWQDGADYGRSRTITLTSDTVLTAVYDLGDSLRGFTPLTHSGAEDGQPDLTVNAVSTDDTNRTLRMWTVIDPQFTNESGTTYKAYATNGYQNLVFDHWEDGSTDRVRTLTITEDTMITAYYREE